MSANIFMSLLLEKIENFFPDDPDMPTLQDLKNPSSSMVIKFLGRALYEFNIDADRWRMAHYCQAVCSKHPENYTDIIPIINLFSIFRKIFQLAEINIEFSMKDILAPRPAQNVKVMNAVMDFLMYADQKVSEMQPIFDEIRSAKLEVAHMEAEKQDLREKINDLISRDADQDRRKRQLTEKLDDLRNKMKSNEEKKENVEKLKKFHITQLQETELKLGKATQAAQQLQEERDKISSLVVDSPQHLKSDIEKQRSKRAESSKKLEVLGQNIAQIKAQNSHLKSVVDRLELWCCRTKQAKELSSTIRALETKLKEESSRMESLERAHKELEKRHANVVKKLEAVEAREKEMCDQNEKALHRLKLNVDEKKEKLQSLTKTTEVSFTTFKTLNAELERATEEYTKAREAFNQVMHLLNDKCNEISQADAKLCEHHLTARDERIAELQKIMKESKKCPGKENNKE